MALTRSKSKIFIIEGKSITLDTSKKYYDFFIDDSGKCLVRINFEGLLSEWEKNGDPDKSFYKQISFLTRWVTEAPRKRGYREMCMEGFHVLSSDEFFDYEGGDQVIDALENTGQLCLYIISTLDSNDSG